MSKVDFQLQGYEYGGGKRANMVNKGPKEKAKVNKLQVYVCCYDDYAGKYGVKEKPRVSIWISKFTISQRFCSECN